MCEGGRANLKRLVRCILSTMPLPPPESILRDEKNCSVRMAEVAELCGQTWCSIMFNQLILFHLFLFQTPDKINSRFPTSGWAAWLPALTRPHFIWQSKFFFLATCASFSASEAQKPGQLPTDQSTAACRQGHWRIGFLQRKMSLFYDMRAWSPYSILAGITFFQALHLARYLPAKRLFGFCQAPSSPC